MIQNRKAHRAKEALDRRGADSTDEVVSAIALASPRWPQHDIMTVKEAADYVRLGKPTLDRMRVTGEGPQFAKLGGAVRYRRADLESWLASKLISSTSQAA